MYGPTGAGKTYTMLGTEKKRSSLIKAEEIDLSFLQADQSPEKAEIKTTSGNSGILFYALNYIIKSLNNVEDEKQSTNIIKCTYVEIYNDCIYDLLHERNSIHNPLAVTELDTKEFVIKDAIEYGVNTINDFITVVATGESKL
jgi:hypothetical protein